jgi:hypothetical protein
VTANQALFVPTDAKGVQHHLEADLGWPLPAGGREGDWIGPAESGPQAGRPLPLLTLDGLLEELGERIFVAEVRPGVTTSDHEPGVVTADSARLARETAWSVHEAANFALDCAEHVLAEPTGLKLHSGATLEEVMSAARSWLDNSGGDTGLLGRVSRIATARRLRRRGDEVGDLAFAIMLEDESEDLDAMEDPDWEAVAAVRDAVLSAVEALRHDAAPQLLESENTRYEEDNTGLDSLPEPVDTPWGSFIGGRRAGVVPAHVAARDAAGRAREAASKANGAEAGAAERSWQLERLRAALGLADSL